MSHAKRKVSLQRLAAIGGRALRLFFSVISRQQLIVRGTSAWQNPYFPRIPETLSDNKS